MDMGLILGSAQYNVHSFVPDEFFCLTPTWKHEHDLNVLFRRQNPRTERRQVSQGPNLVSNCLNRQNMWRIKGKISVSETPVSNFFSTSSWQTGFPFFSEPHCLTRPKEKQRPARLTGYTKKAQYFRIFLTV